MKTITLLVSFFISFTSLAQKNMSYVDDSTRKEIIRLLIENKSKADLPDIYDELNYNSRIIRIISAGVVVKHTDTATFNLDILNHLRAMDQYNYLIYNVQENGRNKIIGVYSANVPSMGIQMYPPESIIRKTYLEEITRYYDINKVELYDILGLDYCIKVDNEIWFIDGDKRTDLNTFIKEEYKTLKEFRRGLLFEDSPHPFGTGSY